MKTIQVTDEMYEFLMDLSKELSTQDHRCTAMPYFFQIQEVVETPTGEGMGEDVWVCDGDIALRTREDIKEAVFEYKEWSLDSPSHQAKFEKLYSFEIEDILEKNYQKFSVTKERTYKNAFLTERACREHIKANNYHYSQPSDFLTHAFRNPELEKVMEFILSLTNNSLHK